MKVNHTTVTTKPWDAQLAYLLIRPLKNSWVSPNHLTTVRFVTGLASAVTLAVGNISIGAWLFVLSNFLDHTDGELARLSGKTSKWGHLYDLACDAANPYPLVRSDWMQSDGQPTWDLGVADGIISGLSVACIFHLRNEMEQQFGKDATRQPHFAGFEVEDVLYLFPVMILFPSLVPFLISATIGAPIFAVWTIWQYRSQIRTHGSMTNEEKSINGLAD
jgi:hypothetical protein